MQGGFQNPPIGNQGNLNRIVEKSENFLTGVSGWAIYANGDAEFNDVTIRGGVTEDSTFFLYNGTPGPGTLIVALSATAGTDPFGNTYQAGITIENGGALTAIDGGGFLSLNSSNTGGAAALQYSTLPLGTAGHTPGAIVPLNPGAGVFAAEISSEFASGETPAIVQLVSSQGAGTFPEMLMNCVFSAANIVIGSVTITPSAANTPTSHAIAYSISGNSFMGLTSYNSTLPGTHVTGTSITGISASGATIWLTRTDTTATIVYYLVWGV